MRKRLLILICFFVLCSLPGAVFSYDDSTTHPALTNNAIDFYNPNAERKISDKEKEWILTGSQKEDTPPRWINHFYDPIYNEGWTGEKGPEGISQDLLKKFSDVFLSFEDAVSAKNWVNNQELQEKYKLYEGNKTWDKAVYEYVKNKDKKEAFLALGHVLHLLQDMAVPEHTRNDTHAGDSPYENYCSQYNKDNFYVANDLKEKPVLLNSLEEYFNELANYSNKYFFSKDTINDPKYDEPKIINEDDLFGYGLDRNKKEFMIVLVDKNWNKEKKGYDIFYLLDKNEASYYPILQSYWQRLSREAILSSAGLIDLFFKEVERAEKDPSLLKEPPKIKSAIVSVFGELIRAEKFFSSARNWFSEKIAVAKNIFFEPAIIAASPAAVAEPFLNSESEASVEEKTEETSVVLTAPEIFLPEPELLTILAEDSDASMVETARQTQLTPEINTIQPIFIPSLVPVPFGAGGGGGINSVVIPEMLATSTSDVDVVEAAATTTEPTIPNLPIIINEVAWAGTAASAYDEWIELYNKGEEAINLEGLVLYSKTDEGPYINLTGEVEPGGYYLIERTDDTAVSDTTADWTGSFGNGLSNSGEILSLSHSSTTIDETILLENGDWPAGDNGNKYTMERYDINAPGTSTENWASNNNFVKNGKDSAGNLLKGTPRAKNSASSSFSITSDIENNLTLQKLNNPVIINNALVNLKAGATLTLKPGAVVKFKNDAGLNVYGKIVSEGDVDDPITFTSFEDNEYWFGITIKNTGEHNSSFSRTNFKRGGKYYDTQNQHRAILTTEGPVVSVSDCLFEYSKIYGLKLVNSDSQIRDNIFTNNNQETDPGGIDSAIYVSGGNPVLENNSFANNNRGLYLENSGAVVNSNTFTSNTGGAVYSFGSLPSFSGNSGTNNSPNAIKIWGNLVPIGLIRALNSNSLSYYISGNEETNTAAGSTLLIATSTVIKSNAPLKINGNLTINGENPEDIIFTSFYDDTSGGDTNNDAGAAFPQPGQFKGIYISETGSLSAKGFTMRYAGSTSFGGNDAAGINLNGSVAEISNAVFQNNYPYGIYAVNSENVKIENARFENHNCTEPWGQKAAMAIMTSTTTLTNIVFENNLLGILSDGLSSIVASLVSFINNTATTSPEGLF